MKTEKNMKAETAAERLWRLARDAQETGILAAGEEPGTGSAGSSEGAPFLLHRYGKKMLPLSEYLLETYRNSVGSLRDSEAAGASEYTKWEALCYVLDRYEKACVEVRREICSRFPERLFREEASEKFEAPVTAELLDNGILELRMPALLPGRTYHGNTQYRSESIGAALEKIDLSAWDRTGKYWIFFVRFYGNEREKAALRDCDNVEEKFVIDALKYRLFADDDPFHVSAVCGRQRGDGTKTAVSVVPERLVPEAAEKLIGMS